MSGALTGPGLRPWRDGDDLRIDAIFIVPRSLPRHLTNIWQA